MAKMDERTVRCPECHGIMEEGCLPVTQGLTWIKGRNAEGNHFAESLPGTHAVMRPNHIMGWRCRKCRVITFKYGKSLEQKPSWQRQQEAMQSAKTDADVEDAVQEAEV
ncbi:hypothetical protein KS4_28550 [Poriferisphaera corsica]|uniref:DUF6487 domain-containing protein n=1 Tax=Poriferisphaera corsica TaxID=2528020 RepID=A0A517YX30_9BACT|nr:PF20097 family protein [Poriferisphaera corsica]QDU34780.1 hypothetical protein KS4_28550 [Poriferisphaera corsica]